MSNRLPILADTVRSAQNEIKAAGATMAVRSLEIGHALLEAKALTGHGEWLPFLKAAGIPERTAQRYMQVAEGQLGPDTVSDLGGITPAIEFLRKRRDAQILLSIAVDEARAGFEGLLPLMQAINLMEDMAAMFSSSHDGGAA